MITLAAETSAGIGTLTFPEIAADTEADDEAVVESATDDIGISDGRLDVTSAAEVAPGAAAVAFPAPFALLLAVGAEPMDELEDEDGPTRKKFPAIGLSSLVLRAKWGTLKLNLDVDALANIGPITSKSCG